MNVFMFSSFFVNSRVKKMLGELPSKTIAYIPAGYADTPILGVHPGYYDAGFRRGMCFPLGKFYSGEREKQLFNCDAIHLGGGNTFELLFMLHARGLIGKLQEYVKNGGILMGSSAGSIVMCPDISIAKFADENWLKLEGDELSSLGLVDFYMKPHWEAWKHAKKSFKEFSMETGKTIYCLRENQCIHITENGLDFIGGNPTIIHP